MRTFLTISIFLFVFITNFTWAQSKSITILKSQFRANKFREYKEPKLNYDDFFQLKADLLGLGESNMIHLKTIKGANQFMHQKFQQYYQGYPVYKAIYILHTKNGLIESSNGILYPDINIENKISLSEEDCFNLILKSDIKKATTSTIDEKVAVLKNKKKEFNLKSSQMVVTDRAFPKFSGLYVYGYSIVVESKSPMTKMEYLVDANSGRIIFSQSLIKGIDVPSRGKTKYYGTQNFISDSLGPKFFALTDNGRNISTQKAGVGGPEEFINMSSTWNLVNADQDEVALDAHYCTSRFHDMMKDHLDYIGLDGQGEGMNPIVHSGKILNAFWTGEHAEFGDGDCNHGPLTSLSIVAHEFTHGVTERNSNLIYSGESGGLNEAFSDIFGKACEYLYDRGRFTWELDPTIKLYPYLESLRSFSDPNRVGNPKNYGGLYWQDNGEVHSTSNVLNHWFYLLVEGKSGVNEFNYNYNIPKQQLLDVIKILFSCQTSYLEPTSNYSNLAFYTIKASDEIFGTNSVQTNAIIEAWKAVNVKPEVSIDPQESFDLEFELSLENSLICQIPVMPEYIVTIRNTGDLVAKAGTVVPFIFYLVDELTGIVSLYNGDIKIDTDIEAGEEYETSIKNLLSFDKVGSYFAFVMFQFKDDDGDNNTSLAIFQVLSSFKNDLGIDLINFKPMECGSNIVNSIFNIVNWSCVPIPSNTKIQIELKDNNNKLITINHTLIGPLEPGDFDIVSKDITITSGANEFNLELKYSKDENLANNRLARPLVIPFIDKSVLFGFSDNLHEKHLAFKSNTELLTKDFNSNQYLYTSGFGQGIPKVFLPCSEDSLNFTEGSNSLLTTCLDLSKIDHSKLSFDLVQFQSDSFGIPEVKNRTTILQVKWSNNNTYFTKYIYGQKESDIVHYEFPLPEKFLGDLELGFYNVFGNGPDSSKSLIFDHQLLDNFSITPINATKDYKNQLSIYPNPVLDQIVFSTEMSNFKTIRIYNLQGKLVKEHYFDGSILNVEYLIPGMYSLKYTTKPGEVFESRFVKI